MDAPLVSLRHIGTGFSWVALATDAGADRREDTRIGSIFVLIVHTVQTMLVILLGVYAWISLNFAKMNTGNINE